MLTKGVVTGVFNEFVMKTGLYDVTLEVHDFGPRGVAMFDTTENKIHVDVARLNHLHFEFLYDDLSNFEFTLKEYLRVVMAHEIGHALDRKNVLSSVAPKGQWLYTLSNSKNKMVQQKAMTKLLGIYTSLEEAAWQNGEKYIPRELVSFYDEIYRQSLANGIQQYESSLQRLIKTETPVA